jgi:DNA-binding transcriptional ArsR family regulator
VAELTTPAFPDGFILSPQMARALTDPVRSRILGELDRRPLSPSQFARGTGGEVSSIARCFRQLASWGFAEVVAEATTTRRGAAVEHLYRAVSPPRLKFVSPAELFFSDRTTLPRRTLSSSCAQIVEAVEAGTFDQELDRHLAWEVILLDRQGRSEVSGRLERLDAFVAELGSEPGARDGSADLIPASLGICSFRSTHSVNRAVQSADRRHPLTLTPELAMALSNRWRSRILQALLRKPMSPSRFVEEVGGDHSYVSRCFRDLASSGWIAIDEERRGGRRGGGVERIYRLSQLPYIDSPTWRTLPFTVRNVISESMLISFFERLKEGIGTGALDRDPDSHVSCRRAGVRRETWNAVCEQLDSLFDLLPGLQQESLARTGGNGSQLIPTLVTMAWFRTPAH